MTRVGANSTMWRVLLQPYNQGKITMKGENGDAKTRIVDFHRVGEVGVKTTLGQLQQSYSGTTKDR